MRAVLSELKAIQSMLAEPLGQTPVVHTAMGRLADRMSRQVATVHCSVTIHVSVLVCISGWWVPESAVSTVHGHYGSPAARGRNGAAIRSCKWTGRAAWLRIRCAARDRCGSRRDAVSRGQPYLEFSALYLLGSSIHDYILPVRSQCNIVRRD